MNKRRLRVVVLVLGLTLSATTLCVVIEHRSTTTVCDCPVPVHLVDGATEPSADVSESAQEPFVRKAMPFHGGTAAVPIPVQLVSSLERIGPADYPNGKLGEPQTFHSTQWSEKDPGRIVLTLSLSDGFGGPGVTVVLDTHSRTAIASAWCTSDVGLPFEHGWENVRGTVRLLDWNLTPASLVDIDIQGELEGRTFPLHLCHDLMP
jgi:hypothetical protein